MDSSPIPGSGTIGLADISPTDRPWDIRRASGDAIARMYGIAFPHYQDRINGCSQILGFEYVRDPEGGDPKLKLRTAKFCRVRLCPVCQWRRSLMWRARFLEAFPRIVGDYPTARFVFLTLTVRNCSLTDLRANISHLNKSWARLVKRKRFPAIGWVKSVEVTRNAATGEAHPHLHVLMMVGSGYFGKNYIKQADWRVLWQQSLKVDYLPVVNIKTIKAHEGDTDVWIRGVLETIKYQTKPDELVAAGPEWLAELTRQLHKTRAVAVGGIFKTYISEEEPEDLIGESESEDEVTVSDIRFGWVGTQSRYIKQ